LGFLEQFRQLALNFFKDDAQIAMETAAARIAAIDPKLEKIKRKLFNHSTEDTRTEIGKSGSVSELKQTIADIITKNEVLMKETEHNISKIEEEGSLETEKVREGGISDREKMNTLRRIKRLAARHKSFKKRLDIFQQNIDLHQNLADKVNEISAMDLKSVKAELIDEIDVDYEEAKENHREYISSEKAMLLRKAQPEETLQERQELRELEKAILGSKPKASSIPDSEEEFESSSEEEFEE